MAFRAYDEGSEKRTMRTVLDWFKDRGDIFHLSEYGLAIFRIGLGIFIILEQLFVLRYFKTLHSATGIAPFGTLQNMLPGWGTSFIPSVHALLTGDLPVRMLFVFQVVLALSIVIGFGGRLFKVITIYLLASFNMAIFPFIQPANMLLLWLTLFAALTPTDRVLATVESRGPEPAKTSLVLLGMFFVAIISHAFALSWPEDGWRDGTALKIMLERSDMATSLGRYLAPFVGVNEIANLAVRYLQLWGPFLLFVPLVSVRIAICLAMALLYLSFGVLFHQGNQNFLMAILWIGLLPRQFFRAFGFVEMPEPKDFDARSPIWPIVRVGVLGISAVALVVGIVARRMDPPLNLYYPTLKQVRATGFSNQFRPVFYTAGFMHWPWVYARDLSGKTEIYDFIDNLWLAGDSPLPSNLMEEVFHTPQFRGIVQMLVAARPFWSGWAHFLCRRITLQREYQEVETVRHTIQVSLTGEHQLMRRSTIFKVNCSELDKFDPLRGGTDTNTQ